MDHAEPSSTNRLAITSVETLCMRCGYDLRGLSDETACPECGLLAQRSRLPTEELKHARPRWLWKLSVGIWLVLLAQMAGFAWGMFGETLLDAASKFAYANSFRAGFSRSQNFFWVEYATQIRLA